MKDKWCPGVSTRFAPRFSNQRVLERERLLNRTSASPFSNRMPRASSSRTVRKFNTGFRGEGGRSLKSSGSNGVFTRYPDSIRGRIFLAITSGF